MANLQACVRFDLLVGDGPLLVDFVLLDALIVQTASEQILNGVGREHYYRRPAYYEGRRKRKDTMRHLAYLLPIDFSPLDLYVLVPLV